MAVDYFHPVVRTWFERRFDGPTDAQALGWPAIAQGRHTLIAAPTGSGKTLAAFLVSLDGLVRQALNEAGDPSAGPEPAPDSIRGQGLPDATQVVYVSPLKALANDIQRNLIEPLAEITAIAAELGTPLPEIRVAVRTGDTSPKERALHTKRPPHVLITTPESLFILLTSERGRNALKSVRTLILDELHALVSNKRGSHLALSVERLCNAAEGPVTRIGLSATQKPIEEVARFLVGTDPLPHPNPLPQGEGIAPRVPPAPQLPSPFAPDGVAIVNTGHRRAMDVAIELPKDFELGPIATHELWAQLLDQIAAHVGAHRTTLVFVNTRRLVERVAHLLSDRLGEENVVAHHGSLSRETRFDAEQRLKSGAVKVCVATASLELGIDIGDVDLVCLIGSPRNIGVALQRVGRSGHFLGGLPKGRFYPLTRDELVESAALLRAIQAGKLDALRIPPWPLDVLAQQIVAACATDEWAEDDLFRLVTSAYPYRELPREQFDGVVTMLSEGIANRWGRGSAYLHRDGVHRRVKARRGARLSAITSGGAIPDTADYLVIAEPDGGMVGTVNEDFAVESMAGDVFLLGNTAWKIRRVESGVVRVEDAHGQAPTIPFWMGEAPGRTVELSSEVAELRREVDERLPVPDTAIAWLLAIAGVTSEAAAQIVAYVAEGKRVLGVVPTDERLVAERFFDEAGGMQLIIHSPWGSRVNRAWGLALRKRMCRAFDFELQAAATDDGINISLGPQHSFPVEEIFRYVKSNTAEDVLLQAVFQSPIFPTRWRWTASRALALLRHAGGKRVPTPIQRMRSDDLMAAVFPAAAACQDNRPADADIEPPDHPLVFETVRDCLNEALDLDGLKALLSRIERGEIETYGVDTVQPSVFSHQILNAMPYAFLDDAPLEERRARAVTLRRALPEDARDLGALDADAIAVETANAWPAVRDADELHDALLSLGVLASDEVFHHADNPEKWHAWLRELQDDGMAFSFVADDRIFWLAAERAPLVAAAYELSAHPLDQLGAGSELVKGPPQGLAEDSPTVPDHAGTAGEVPLDPGFRRDDGDAWVAGGSGPFPPRGKVRMGAADRERLAALLQELEEDETAGSHLPEEALVELLRGRVECSGPFTVGEMAARLALALSAVGQAVARLEGEGLLLRGRFRPLRQGPSLPRSGRGGERQGEDEFCDRRILARIHRSTISKLRQSIEPVPVASFIRFLLEWQHTTPGSRVSGETGLLDVVEQLQGYEAAAVAWEGSLLPSRLRDYSGALLDALCFSGEIVWGRFARRGGSPANDARTNGSAPAPPKGALGRNGPLSLGLRDDVDWLLDAQGAMPLSGAAEEVLDYLRARGASFLPDIVDALHRLPSDAEDALWQLVTAGYVTADGFGALRGLVSGATKRAQRRSRFARRTRAPRARGSRWALLRPGDGPHANEPMPDDVIEARGAQLLRRYGVLTRELLAREPMAPPWGLLARVFRRAEARGEIRGGRFIAGLVGEQFALPEAVDALRAVHRRPVTGEVVRVSASDPLNLVGILTPGERMPAVPGNEVVYRDGVPLRGADVASGVA